MRARVEPALPGTPPTLGTGVPQAASISLPKGGGAIRGIDEKVSANPVSGTANVSVPVPVSPGRSGLQPALTLSYDSGAGNGPFGLGWSLGLPAVTRKTDKGLPRYEDEDESDVFLLSGAEDLVPRLVRDPVRGMRRHSEARRVAGEDYLVRRYRPRTSGLFARIERWTNVKSGETHWRSISRDNLTTLYGRTSESRISDPGDPRRVFSWLVCETRDDKGNAIHYRYKPEEPSGIDPGRVEESHRLRPGAFTNRYLKRVLYGNRTPCAPGEDLAARRDWMFEVVLDYGEHDATDPTPQDDVTPRRGRAAPLPWELRPDAFSAYRSGFELRTYRLCRRLLVFHHFPGEPEVGANCLVRALKLAHETSPIASVLTRIESVGFRREGSGYVERSLPPLELEYSKSDLLDPAAPAFEVRDLPLASLENLPIGIDGAYQWVDLDGEGLNGVLTDGGGGWFYKRNLGGGRFAPVERLALAPARLAAGAGTQLLDLDGDGQIEMVELAGATPGFYEREQDGWSPFRAFDSHPVLDWGDPNLRFLDLSGDGHADIVLAEDEAFTWHPSLGSAGFGKGLRSPWSADEDRGPRLLFADGTDTIFLADMSGDGLTDLVRVRNGEICYWPNVGYGRFGAKVTMGRAPVFEAPDLFDPRRIRLADVDGSGVADILYLSRGGVDVYLNESGNAWSPVRRIEIPLADTLSSVQVIDLLGKGTPCLVWSTALPGEASRPLRYVDLMTAKPYLLTATRNNLGAETRASYAPSTRFYCEDRDAGRPWITKLPFPVHVVERVETYDRISGNRFVSRYAYHHGYFDGHEREFRGFGLVEQRDTEEFATHAGGGSLPAATNLDAASHVPPVLTKTWFHTGSYLGGEQISDFFAGLLPAGGPGEYYREPGLTDAEARQRLLPDTVLPPDLTADERREACRALKGTMLRQEIYALDGTARAGIPYSVVEQSFSIRRLQPQAGNRHAVFFTHPRETLSYHYERRPADPRISHALTLEVDEYGNVLKQAAVGYGRRQPDPALPESADRDKQTRTLLTFTDTRVTTAIDAPDDHRAPLPCETRTYELTGYTPTGASGRFQPGDLVQPDPGRPERLALVSDGEIAYQDLPTNGRQRRLIEHVRTLYRRDDLTALSPLGELQPLALAGESYKLALTPGLLAGVLKRKRPGRPDEDLLPNPTPVLVGQGPDQGGYVVMDGNWWIPSGRSFFDSNANAANAASTASQERNTARRHFYLPRKVVDAFGHSAALDYDTHDLLVTRTSDALGNSVVAVNDYRVLAPRLVTDPNRNRTALAFDALGLVVATALMGKSAESLGDLLEGLNPDPPLADLQAFAADPHGRAASLLGRATTRFVYDLDRHRRADQPPFAATLARETHYNDPGGARSRIQVAFGYTDGFGREIQKKAQAEAGSAPERQADVRLPAGDIRAGDLVRDAQGRPAQARAPRRWVGSGRTVFNNKGKPVRQYEPFFSPTHLWEREPEMTDTGVSSVLFYDPVGRVVATLHPDHTCEKVVFDAWQQATYDRGDTVTLVPSADADVKSFFLHTDGTPRVPASEYLPTWHALRTDAAHASEAARRWPDAAVRNAERDAALRAAAHADTPARVHLDALGRPFLTLADNGPDPAQPSRHLQFATRVDLDIEGNQRTVRDAVVQDGDRLGRIVMRYHYDLLGNRLRQESMEAGERWLLNDATGKPIRAWDSRRFQRRLTYDALRRPIGLYVTENGTERLAEETTYGEGQGDAANHRTRAYQLRDGAGLVTSEAYDFKGNLLASQRRLLADYKTPVNWSTNPALEGGAPFTSRTTYDALDRPLTATSPDGSVYRPSFNEANLLDAVGVNLRGAAAATPFVTGIDYDAKGQREQIAYANGALTSYTHDPLTFRLTQMKTTRPRTPDAVASQLFRDAAVVQDLRYTHDPTGNIVRIEDAALKIVRHNGQQVDPVGQYTYDALSRLIEAQGREHRNQTAFAFNPSGGDLRDYPFAGNGAHPNDLQALRRYTERYEYDAVGNFQTMRHSATGGDWTRRYDYEEGSLIEARKRGNRLSRTTLGNGLNRSEAYSHDAHGSMSTMPHLAALVWDFKDQLQQVDLGGGGTAHYVYDAAGERVRKVIESQGGVRRKERLYLGGFEIYREYGGYGTSVTLARESLHVMDDQRRIALVETQTIASGNALSAPAQVRRFQLGNHLDSASAELAEDGALVSYEEYHPYGTSALQAGRSAVELRLKRYRYASKERDEETGYRYHGARYDAPWLGRWISCDPAGLVDGPNLYPYARSSPAVLVDRDGRQAGNAGDPLGIVEREDGRLYARYRAKEGTWISASAKEAGMGSNYPGERGYGAYSGDVLDVEFNPIGDPDRVPIGREYLIPIEEKKRSILVNTLTGRTIDTKADTDYGVYTTTKEDPVEGWKDSQRLLYQIKEITGRSGGTRSRRGQPVNWSNLKDLSEAFQATLDRGISFFEEERKSDERARMLWSGVSGDKGLEAAKLEYFRTLVTDKAEFDIKNREYAPTVIGEWSFYKGKLWRYDDYGNFLFGAVGTAFGIDSQLLLLGAEVNQQAKDSTARGADEPQDQRLIKAGIHYYLHEHGRR